jgi:hypothetical protein
VHSVGLLYPIKQCTVRTLSLKTELVYFHPEHNNIIFLNCGCILLQLFKGLYLGNNNGMGRKRTIQNDHLEIQEVEGSRILYKGLGARIHFKNGWKQLSHSGDLSVFFKR